MEVVAQRRIHKKILDYCPGFIETIEDNNNTQIRFGDNVRVILNNKHVFKNNPDDILERNNYNNILLEIYKKDNDVLADVTYNFSNSTYDYGKIDRFNISALTCDVIFKKYGLVKSIPLSKIITPCDNRYRRGIDEKIIQEEKKPVIKRKCVLIENITNDKPEIKKEPKKKNDFKIPSYLYRFLLFLNITSILYTIYIIYTQFEIYYPYFSITRFKYINIILILLWIVFISFSLGPLYLILFSITWFLYIFSFRVSFPIYDLLGGKTLYWRKLYMILLIAIFIGYIILIK